MMVLEGTDSVLWRTLLNEICGLEVMGCTRVDSRIFSRSRIFLRVGWNLIKGCCGRELMGRIVIYLAALFASGPSNDTFEQSFSRI